jgi:hypothetical protein
VTHQHLPVCGRLLWVCGNTVQSWAVCRAVLRFHMAVTQVQVWQQWGFESLVMNCWADEWVRACRHKTACGSALGGVHA